MKNCPSFKQKPEKQLRPAVQEQLPVEENAWPGAESYDPAVKVRLWCSMSPLLLWAVGSREGRSMRGKYRCEEKSRDTLCWEARDLSLREWEVFLQTLHHFPAELGNPLSASLSLLCSKSCFPNRTRHSRQVGAVCSSKGCSRPPSPILTAAGFSPCPISAQSSNPTLVHCHGRTYLGTQSACAYVSTLQTSCKGNIS